MLSILKAVFAVAFLLLFSSSTAPAQSIHMSLEELSQTSTAIVLGETQQTRSFWNENRSQILTEITVRVDESLKGSVGAETVITVPGGRVGNALYEVSDMPVFVDGEEILVFLWEHPTGKTIVTGGAQGKLEVLVDPISGAKRLRGHPRADGEATAFGKTGAQFTPDSPNRGVPLDDVLAQIRSFAND